MNLEFFCLSNPEISEFFLFFWKIFFPPLPFLAIFFPLIYDGPYTLPNISQPITVPINSEPISSRVRLHGWMNAALFSRYPINFYHLPDRSEDRLACSSSFSLHPAWPLTSAIVKKFPSREGVSAFRVRPGNALMIPSLVSRQRLVWETFLWRLGDVTPHSRHLIGRQNHRRIAGSNKSFRMFLNTKGIYEVGIKQLRST